MCYYILFKMSVKEFTLKMPEWGSTQKMNGKDIVKSRRAAFIDFKKDIIKWLKDQGKIAKQTADDQIQKLENQYEYTNDYYIQNLTNVPGAVTRIESQTSTMFGAGNVRTVTIDKKELPLTFTDPLIFNDTMSKEGVPFIDNYGISAGTTYTGVLFPKEATQFRMTINAEKIPNNYSPDQYPTMRLGRGGRRKSRKLHKKRYTRRVASRKYRNRK